MNIYTKQGDKGTTQLIGGKRVSKNNDQIDAYGTVDELSSIIGGIDAHISGDLPEISEELHMIQSDLFYIGTILANPEPKSLKSSKNHLSDKQVIILENAIDRMTVKIPPLKSFILPAGHVSAAFAHMARSVCRRAERKVVGLIEKEHYSDTSGNYFTKELMYLNRLSDYLFVLARFLNYQYKNQEILVTKKISDQKE